MSDTLQKVLLGSFVICGLITSGGELVAQESEPSVSENASAESEGSEAPITEIVVRGVRRSLSQARDLKRESEQFVDFIVADDIGKLPDANVAESLQRVSGVQIDRGIGGEGINIAIRGLRQNLILFNGRQILDAEGRGGNGPDTLGSRICRLSSCWNRLGALSSRAADQRTIRACRGDRRSRTTMT